MFDRYYALQNRSIHYHFVSIFWVTRAAGNSLWLSSMADNESGERGSAEAAPAIEDPKASLSTKTVLCVKCEEQTSVDQTMSAGRSGRVCKLCYNAQRALMKHFTKRNQKQQWDNMPPERKKKLIKENKFNGGTMGRERQLKITDEALQSCNEL